MNIHIPKLTQQQKHFKKAFQSAISIDEMLQRFKQMESHFPESELGIECWTLTRELLENDCDLQQVLSFGKRALKIFLSNDDNNIRSFGERVSKIVSKNVINGGTCTRYHGSGYFVATVCNFLGSASVKLDRYNEGLSYLNWANRNLTKLENYGDEIACSGDCLLLTLRANHCLLFEVKTSTGNSDDIVDHTRKILEIDEKMREEGCIELGQANKMVSDAYLRVNNFEQALPFALKALEIYTRHGVGDDSVEFAQVRRNLGLVYSEFGEREKALELLRLSLTGLTSSQWLAAQMEVANMSLALGKNEEAIEAFKSLISRPETEGNHQARGVSLTGMAMGFCNMGKFTDARKYMKIARKVLEKKQVSPSAVAVVFARMSSMYEEMKDNESACLYLRKALAIPELPHENLIDCSRRLFLLLNENPKEQTGFSYLEEVVDRLKEKLGPEQSLVGYGYQTLGVSYMYSGKLETAAECFMRAKNVFGVSLGPHHEASLEATRLLVLTYESMESIHQALEIQEKVVASLRGLESSKREFLASSVKILNRLKERDAKSPTSASPESKVSEDLAATISKCGISDDGREIKFGREHGGERRRSCILGNAQS